MERRSAVFASMFVEQPDIFVFIPIGVLAAVLTATALVTTAAFAALLLRYRPSALRSFQRALQTAEVGTAVVDMDGSLTFACAEGLFVGPRCELVPFEGDQMRLESVAWTEETHSLLIQVWRVVRARHTEHEVIDSVCLPLSSSVSSDEGLRQALTWNERAWRVRHRGGPAAASSR